MDDLQHMELRDAFAKASDTPLFDVIGKLRRNKPGPKKKDSPRSEKESCRLTKEEDTQFRTSGNAALPSHTRQPRLKKQKWSLMFLCGLKRCMGLQAK